MRPMHWRIYPWIYRLTLRARTQDPVCPCDRDRGLERSDQPERTPWISSRCITLIKFSFDWLLLRACFRGMKRAPEASSFCRPARTEPPAAWNPLWILINRNDTNFPFCFPRAATDSLENVVDQLTSRNRLLPSGPLFHGSERRYTDFGGHCGRRFGALKFYDSDVSEDAWRWRRERYSRRTHLAE